jgi:RNA polymerase sigma-70 factor (ECF subfamily)
MQPAPELEQLMVRYQQGDPAAVGALVQRLSPQLHRFFLAQFVSRRYADDLLQDTWLRVHEARHTYRAGEPVLPWLYALARHVRVDHYRKARRREERERQVEELPEVAAAEPAAARGPDVTAMLRELPESQREVLVMLKVSGMSIEEVARATASSAGSVKQKAHRAYEKLRRLYEA